MPKEDKPKTFEEAYQRLQIAKLNEPVIGIKPEDLDIRRTTAYKLGFAEGQIDAMKWVMGDRDEDGE